VIFPQQLEVPVTRQHLNKGRRAGYQDSALTFAVRDVLVGLGLPFTDISATEHSIRIYSSHSRSWDARYYVPDDAWKLVARHQAGRRVKPAVFTLEAVYRRL
jgi:hypothetical protein